MRPTAYVIIFLGVLLLAAAVNSERKGIAIAAAPTELPTLLLTAKRTENAAEFRNLMVYQWAEAGLTFLTGLVLLLIVRRADTLDPFSRTFAGSEAIDDLERTLSREDERRKRPL